MSEQVNVLDSGYIRLVESWGSDERIIEAARMSTAKGFLGWGPVSKCSNCGDLFDAPERDCQKPIGTRPLVDCGRGGHHFADVPGDEKLLRFLWENAHATPFEMAGAIVEVKAPIFVFREWHRHRTQSYSEVSARYTPLPDDAYVPEIHAAVRRSREASEKNKQAGVVAGAAVLTPDVASGLLREEHELLFMVENLYQRKLKAGFPKEIARTHITVSRYSRMRASANLRNWLGFLTLRCAPNAQWEIRQYADALRSILTEAFPRTLELFGGPRP